MVVHFNRLKLYNREPKHQLRTWRAKDKQPQDSTLPRHHFGAEMELVVDKREDSVTTPHRDDPPQDHGAEH